MISSIFKSILFKLLSPNSVAKLSGVKYGKNCKFLTKSFGSEPYLITIGDNFYTSSHVQFINHDGSINVLRNTCKKLKHADKFGPILIGNNVFLGYGVIVMPDTTIGDNIIVGAGSIVKGNLLSNSVYAGIPAKKICSIDEYKLKVKDSLVFTRLLNQKQKKAFIVNKFNIN